MISVPSRTPLGTGARESEDVAGRQTAVSHTCGWDRTLGDVVKKLKRTNFNMWGFHSHGGTPKNSWFIRKKMPLKLMILGGSPISGKPHMEMSLLSLWDKQMEIQDDQSWDLIWFRFIQQNVKENGDVSQKTGLLKDQNIQNSRHPKTFPVCPDASAKHPQCPSCTLHLWRYFAHFRVLVLFFGGENSPCNHFAFANFLLHSWVDQEGCFVCSKSSLCFRSSAADTNHLLPDSFEWVDVPPNLLRPLHTVFVSKFQR